MIEDIFHDALRKKLQAAIEPIWRLSSTGYGQGLIRISAIQGNVTFTKSFREYAGRVDLDNIFNFHDCCQQMRDHFEKAAGYFNDISAKDDAEKFHASLADRAEVASNA